MSGSVDVERRNGSSQRRYHGYTTGAHARDAAIGHAHLSAQHAGGLRPRHAAARTPTIAARPAPNVGLTTGSIVANTGSLNRIGTGYTPIDPSETRKCSRNGTYNI